MNKKLISILVANLFVAAPAFAQSGGFQLKMSVSLGGMHVNDGNAVDASKLNEFRDLSNGLMLGFDVMGRGGSYWMDLFGENVGRDDHYVNLKGGRYDVFKYGVYSNALKHNFLFGGLTPFAGAGSAASLSPTVPPSTNTSTWNSVDSSYKRRNDGGFFEFQGASPWYVRVDGNQIKFSGTKIGSSSNGLSPGNGYTQLLYPTEYTTRNASVEGGYNAKTMHFALSWVTSKFDNDNLYVDWTNSFWGGTDRSYQPADSKYTRLAANATFRQLPLHSTLALRFTDDELKGDQTLDTTVLGAGNTRQTTLPSVATYNGRVENRTFTLALASRPLKDLDTRLYVNRYKRDDKSTHVIFTGTASGGTPYENEPYSYEKKNWGFDAYYRIDRQNRVGAGYDYLDMERHRFDFDRNKDKKWFVEWKTSMLDNVSARLKYTDLKRSANFLLGNDGANSGDILYWNRFLKAFDIADSDQKAWKATVDFSPAEFVDVSIEGTSRDIKFPQTVIGRLRDKRHELYASVSYGRPDSARWTVFGDVENVRYDSRHMVVPFGSTALGTYDPFAPATATKYNWEGGVKDNNRAFGVALDLPATEKLMIKASVVYSRTDGSVELSSNQPAPNLASVSNYDDTKRTSFNLKGVYSHSKTLTFTAGYTYEKFDYKDVLVDGYQYVLTAANNANVYNMGYYANPQYKANIIYGMLTYHY